MGRQAIGIDIGGTLTKVAIVSEAGEISHLETLPTAAREDPEAYLAGLVDRIAALIEKTEISGIGLAAAGFLSDDHRSVRYNPNTPALVGVDFVGLLERFGLPARLEQDLNVPALAEYAFGEFRGAARLMTASIGTGLGAGFILDGRLLDFAGGTIGDTGHLILRPDGPSCTAGCHGCGEALIGTANIERLAEKRGGPQGRHPSAREVITAARDGQPWATEIMAEIANWLGQWLACLVPIFLPSHILLCGGVAEAGEPLRQGAEARLRELAGPAYAECVVALSRFGARAGVIGAAAPFLTSSLAED